MWHGIGHLRVKKLHKQWKTKSANHQYLPTLIPLRPLLYRLTAVKMTSVLFCCRMTNPSSLHPAHWQSLNKIGPRLKETLAVVYGLERFNQYIYGRNVVVYNDHSPLEFILKKTLSQAPKRLQALIMRLHKYNITFQYVPGRSLVLADTLSRAFPTQRYSQEHCVHAMNSGALRDIPDQHLQEIRHATETNEEARQLLQAIRNGWPPQRDQLPLLRPGPICDLKTLAQKTSQL